MGHMFDLFQHPASPCQGICRLEGEVCVGCGRLLGEIAEWSQASAQRKTTICTDASARLAILEMKSTFQDANP